LIILFFYNIYYLPEQLGSDRIRETVSKYGIDSKEFGKIYVKRFNDIHYKKNRKTEIVYSNYDIDKKYYNIRIPRIDFKKFIY